MSTLDFVTGYKTLHSDFTAKNGFSYGEENRVVSSDATPRVGRAGLHIYKTLTDAIEAHPHRPVLAEAIGFGEVDEGRRSYACTHAAITRVLSASEAYAILGAEAHPARICRTGRKRKSRMTQADRSNRRSRPGRQRRRIPLRIIHPGRRTRIRTWTSSWPGCSISSCTHIKNRHTSEGPACGPAFLTPGHALGSESVFRFCFHIHSATSV